ncbi:lipoprotein [Ensifer adhaerens]|uniref:Lipoprotein n=1 Tax=Ensifer adhaerens TaxID=106592 RepID=A0A0L8BFB6_ENSAD|nr:alpha/beta hydrolase [Ensifer adhaerens]KOF13337.1 lipoprotein [Ensifer adhaerens]
MAKTLIIPGLFGSGAGHWQRHWLDDQPRAALVEQDDWDHPVLERWREALEQAILRHGVVDVVAHSLGCILVASLARRPLARQIRSALLVAPCDLDVTERRHPGSIEFGAMPEQPLPFPSLIVGSLNDPYMSFDRLRHISTRWGSRLVDLGHAGHINVASGFGRWSRGYDLLTVLNGIARREHPSANAAQVGEKRESSAVAGR